MLPMKKYIIYHPKPGKDRTPAQVECRTYKEAEAEYKRLQDIYPSREMCLVAVNDWDERTQILSGRWK